MMKVCTTRGTSCVVAIQTDNVPDLNEIELDDPTPGLPDDPVDIESSISEIQPEALQQSVSDDCVNDDDDEWEDHSPYETNDDDGTADDASFDAIDEAVGNITPNGVIDKVFIWLPHHLKSDLKRPVFNFKRIEIKEWDPKSRARRILDLQDCFYLMTVRYECSNPQGAHSFNSYDDGIVKQLDLRVQADFPAVLTSRSGASKQLIKLMRPAFQHGVGPHPLSKILRVLHTKRYDQLQLQYYYVAIDKILDKNGIQAYIPKKEPIEEFSAFDDKNG
ncbi:hypothetical protein MBANPS3_006840 [Mucor bainieri]